MVEKCTMTFMMVAIIITNQDKFEQHKKFLSERG